MPAESAQPKRPEPAPLERGDRLPPVALPDHEGRLVNPLSDALAGRPLLLVFETGDDGAAYTSLLADLEQRCAAAIAEGLLVLGVTRRAVDDNRRLREAEALPFPLLSDAAGATYGSCQIPTAAAPAVTLVVDANLRLAGVVKGGDAQSHIGRVTELLGEVAADEGTAPLGAHPPVLVLPRLLSADDCAWLIEVWHRPVRVWKTDGFTSAGYDTEAGDFKVRAEGASRMLQMVVRDPEVQRHLDARLYRRVVPEIGKAFQTSVSQREDYRIAAYDAAEGGNLGAHRDNPTPQTRHRRFTISVSLNGGSYRGGGLRFREYNRQAYEVPAGTAVIWSCALLHEVLPVTSGRRFILGTHLFGN